MSNHLFGQVRAFLQPPMEGIVLETYGSGNAPDNRADLLEEFWKATERGVIMVNCSQCLRGSVTASYATGKVRMWVHMTLCIQRVHARQICVSDLAKVEGRALHIIFDNVLLRQLQ